ncbi:carboxypeptidase regulatory-like domain-containing protein [bacterium]|nr:carboxypeptidase regulatory-like domain-containing protein [bacterium]
MMTRRLILSFLFVLFTTTFAFPVSQQLSASHSFPVTVSERITLDNGMRLSLQIDGPSWIPSESVEGEALRASYPQAGDLEVDGFPIVPVVGRMFRLPPQGGAVVEVIESEYETFSGVEYALYFGEDGIEPLTENNDLEDAWYPGELARIADPGRFKDFRVSNLVTFPVQVNRARREVRVYSNIQVEIRYEGDDNRCTLPANPTHISEAFLPFYRNLLDWDDSELDEYTLYRGHVQVVMPDNQQLLGLMEPWFEWKKQKGWTIDLLTDDDVNWQAGAIANELEDRYAAAETKFDYVVIVGDANGNYSTPPSQGQGDHAYSTLVGNDNIPDVHIGRISVTSQNEVRTYVNKVIEYERNSNSNDEWLGRGHLSYPSAMAGISPVFIGRWYRHWMLEIGYTQVDTAWIGPWGAGNVNGRSIDRINNGVGLYMCRGGWVGAGLSTNQILSLNNNNMTPVCIDITCGTGSWTGDAITEAYIRAGTPNSPTGGIGAMGTATLSTHTRYNNIITGGSGSAFLVMRTPGLGDILTGGKLSLIDNYAGVDNGYINFLEWYNLMGDPTVSVWSKRPDEMSIEAPDEIAVGSNGVSVRVFSGNSPVKNAWVTWYKVDDNEETMVTGVTDASGLITINPEIRFSGNALLTVSKQNHEVVRQTITVVQDAERVSYNSISIQDDGENGTRGNDNGIPEAGEIVGLRVTAENYGTSDAQNVTVTASSDDIWIREVDGEITYGNLTPGQTSQGDGLILVEVNAASQNEWNAHLTLDFSSNAGNFEDDFALEILAPRYALVAINGVDNFEPGGQAAITITLNNVGGSDGAAGTVVMSSEDDKLTIPQNQAVISAADVGDNAITSSFNIAASASATPGYRVYPEIIITSENGQVDSLRIPIVIGTRTSTDPLGPDSYGYYAFDDTDEDYEAVPTFDWIEINPDRPDPDFNGTDLGINDNGEDNDESVALDLPFDIQYYGEVFDQITVCSNGFVAMGDQSDIAAHRAWTIPSPLGARYMIAPYWDERRMGGNSAIHAYNDVENGRFIVQFTSLLDVSNSNPCTFQVIFYNQITHPTITGDNDFAFQYLEVNHSQGGGTDTQYFTAGIENGDQTDGLLIAYWQRYESGAAPVEDGRVYLFSTDVSVVAGTLQGHVTDGNTGDPLEGIVVGFDGSPRATISNEEGFYTIDLRVGNYDILVDNPPYAIFTHPDVVVDSAEITTVDISLGVGIFDASTDSFLVTLQSADPIVRSMWVRNPGSAQLDVSMRVFPQIETDEFLDVLFDRDMGSVTRDQNLHGLAYAEGRHFITGSNGNVNPNIVYVVSEQGQYERLFGQPGSAEQGADATGFHDLAFDGKLLWGSYNQDLIGMDPGTGLEMRRLAGVFDRHDAITYDRSNDVLWVATGTSDIIGLEVTDGSYFGELDNSDDISGMAWFSNDDDGYPLYYTTVDANSDRALYKANIETNDRMRVASLPYEDDDAEIRSLEMIDGFANDYTALAAIVNTNGDNRLIIWEYDLFVGWALIDPPEFSVSPGDSEQVEVTFGEGELDNGVYRGFIRAEHNTAEAISTFPLTLYLDRVDVGESALAELPDVFQLDAPYPNPFNATTQIRFAVPQTANINLVVFDLLGREVAVLKSQKLEAGHYNVVFNADAFSSGMYFVRMTSETGFVQTQKMMLVK